MATLMWFNSTWPTARVRPAVARKKPVQQFAAARERNDLGWLSLCTSGDSGKLDGDLDQFSLLSQGEPDITSLDPFRSYEARAKG